MEFSPEIVDLRFAAKRKKRAEEERHAAAMELRERVMSAHEAGIPVTRIAREASISRQAVYEMLGIRLLSRRNRQTLP
jgi:DNA invertase Pin-like site-specific DNA recombinase